MCVEYERSGWFRIVHVVLFVVATVLDHGNLLDVSDCPIRRLLCVCFQSEQCCV